MELTDDNRQQHTQNGDGISVRFSCTAFRPLQILVQLADPIRAKFRSAMLCISYVILNAEFWFPAGDCAVYTMHSWLAECDDLYMYLMTADLELPVIN